ncbi:hypothetical protein AKJ16_DCAP17272, partial [Drosera capensis]
VAWDVVCSSKSVGGLGLRDLHKWNLAMLSKQSWAVALKKDSLWIKWVHEVYLKDSGKWEVGLSTSSSWLWRKLLKVRDTVISSSLWPSSFAGVRFSSAAVYYGLMHPKPRLKWLSKGRNHLARLRTAAFAAMVYCIWSARNHLVFSRGGFRRQALIVNSNQNSTLRRRTLRRIEQPLLSVMEEEDESHPKRFDVFDCGVNSAIAGLPSL